jgi:DNA-binding NarL/FixJ family response regulator
MVILDLTIRGGMGGAETNKKLFEIDPHVKTIISSGYSDDATIAKYLELGFQGYLKKPYGLAELKDMLSTFL